jgi:hypothetical protein
MRACASNHPIIVRLVVEHVGVGAAEEMRNENEEKERTAAEDERIRVAGGVATTHLRVQV